MPREALDAATDATAQLGASSWIQAGGGQNCRRCPLVRSHLRQIQVLGNGESAYAASHDTPKVRTSDTVPS